MHNDLQTTEFPSQDQLAITRMTQPWCRLAQQSIKRWQLPRKPRRNWKHKVQHKQQEEPKKEWKQAKHKRDAEVAWRIIRASVIFGDQVCTMHGTYKLHSCLDILAENSCWKIVKHQREVKDDVKHQREVEERLKMGWRWSNSQGRLKMWFESRRMPCICVCLYSTTLISLYACDCRVGEFAFDTERRITLSLQSFASS